MQKESVLRKISKVYVWFYYPIIKILITVFSIVLFVIILGLTGLLLADRTNVINVGIYAIESESMEPHLYKGDAVVIQKQDNYVKGEVITFFPTDRDKKTYTHRVTQVITKDGVTTYKTKGDNNKVEDPFNVKSELIEGKEIYKLEKLGSPILFLRSVPGIILFLIIPATIIATLNFQSLYSSISNLYSENFEKSRKNKSK